jgi:hypothetical protein
MLVIRRCTDCRTAWSRSECLWEPEGLFGPELLCPRCKGIVTSSLTASGWLLTILAAMALAYSVARLSGAPV